MLNFDMKTARAAWTVSAIPILACAIYLLRKTLLIFVVALMFSYLLYPLVDALQRRLPGKSRATALILPFLLVIFVIAGFVVFIGKPVGSEAAALAAQMKSPDFSRHVREWEPMNLPVGEQIGEHYSQLLGMVPEFSKKIAAASKNLVDMLIIPILSFFLLKDGRTLHRRLLGIFPARRKLVNYILADAHRLMLEYMRALLLLCFVTLISFSVCLSLMRVPYSILFAAISFPLEFVPLVGPLAGAAIILGVSAFSGYEHLVWIVAFLAGYRIFQDYVVSPHLMSKGVNMHPLLLIFGVFAGGELGGVAGIFLSVPLLALARLVYHQLRNHADGSKVLAAGM